MRDANRILIAIPFWEKDKPQAIRLASLLTDLQPAHQNLADILFIARFDCPQVDPWIVKKVSRRFNTFTAVSKRREIGWPQGCNGTFFGTIEWFYHRKQSKKIPPYKALFIAEGDGSPIQENWLQRASADWDVAAKAGAYIAGPMVNAGGREHINGGGCMISGDLDFLKWLNRGSARYLKAGWDFQLADMFRNKGWANIPGMRSYWQSGPFSDDRLSREAAQGVYWIHGVKDDSLTDLVRAKLL